jgi:hypothetical protein
MLANAAEIRDEYLRLREVQRGLNSKLLQTVSKKGFEQSARDLGFYEGGKIVLHDEYFGDVLSDYALYEYRAGGKNAVERSLSRGDAPGGTDEHLMLQAMAKARFTLVGIEAVEPDIGVRAVDHFYGGSFLLADMGLSEKGSPQIVLAARVMTLPNFTMTSGAAVRIDPELATLLVNDLREAFGSPSSAALLTPKMGNRVTRMILLFALANLDDLKAALRARTARHKAAPALG